MFGGLSKIAHQSAENSGVLDSLCLMVSGEELLQANQLAVVSEHALLVVQEVQVLLTNQFLT